MERQQKSRPEITQKITRHSRASHHLDADKSLPISLRAPQPLPFTVHTAGQMATLPATTDSHSTVMKLVPPSLCVPPLCVPPSFRLFSKPQFYLPPTTPHSTGSLNPSFPQPLLIHTKHQISATATSHFIVISNHPSHTP